MDKRMYRSKKNKMISGVCGGVAEYFNLDPTVVRIGFVAISLIAPILPFSLIAYIIAVFIMPQRNDEFHEEAKRPEDFGINEDEWNADAKEWKETPKYDSEKSRNVIAIILILLGVVFLGKQLFNWFDARYLVPLGFIGVGGLIIFKNRRNY